MPTARDIMTGAPRSTTHWSTPPASLRDLDVGALPICGDDNRLAGVVTDRDIVVKCVADGTDPATVKVVALADGKPVTVGADDQVDEVLRTMREHGVRRLPVIDGHDLVGIVSLAGASRGRGASGLVRW